MLEKLWGTLAISVMFFYDSFILKYYIIIMLNIDSYFLFRLNFV